MAVYLYNTIEEFQKFVGSGVNVSVNLEMLESSMQSVLKEHIEQWISKEQFEKLVTEVEADNLSAEETSLLPYVQRPLALLTMQHHTRKGAIQISSMGIIQHESETAKGAYKYQVNDYRDVMWSDGFNAIEQMLIFLEDNEADYPLWVASSAYQRNKSLFINYTSVFRDLYSKNIGRYAFEVIRPILNELELILFQPMLGDNQYTEIKDNILAKTLTAEETELLTYIQRPLCHFAIREGIRRELIQFKGDRVIQTESLEPQSSRKESNPSLSVISVKDLHQDEFGNRMVSLLTKFLTDNIDDYPLYKAFKEAEAEAEAEEESTDTEERCGRYGRWNDYCSTTEKPKGFASF